MAPAPKRRKTTKVLDSDDDVDESRQQTNTLSNFLQSSPNSKASASRGPTASPSPKKTRAKAAQQTASQGQTKPIYNSGGSPGKKNARVTDRGKPGEKGKSGDLVALFSKQAQKAPLRNKNNSNNNNAGKSTLVDDLFSDPISDDDIAETKPSSASFIGQNARKRARDGVPVDSSQGFSSSASSRFLKPARPVKAPPADEDLRPWSERFGPVNLDELAVHKKKVSDVRGWLENVLSGRLRQRLLILKGAAGSAKTMTMRLLAKDLGCELLEWKNPTGTAGATLGYSSASAQFQEFLGRGGKFGQLDTDTATLGTTMSASQQPAQTSTRRIILIEEFPNTFARSSTALTSFRNTILGYLAANTPSLAVYGQQQQQQQQQQPSNAVVPVVMIISETLLTTTSASADSFTAHRLLGQEILRHPGAGIIEFNAIAPSILGKALELVVVKEARKSGRKRTPGPLVLKRLCEIGDIRSAISSLEFLCLKGDQDADWGAKVAFTKSKKSVREGISMTKGEFESLELISQREASLGIFHAVGKVVYNKRDDQAPANDTVERLQPHLSHNSRPKRSQVAADTLIDEIGTDTQTFVSALHENYALSCESPIPLDGSGSLDYLNNCIEYLSESDLLCPSWDIFFGGRGFGGGFRGGDSGSHVLRQDEIAFHVAVRGMIFSLPNPVKRKAPNGSRNGDAFKMFYPTSIKLWRTKEEFEGLVDMWSIRLLKDEENAPKKDITQGAAAFRRPKPITSGNSWVDNKQSRSLSKTNTSQGSQQQQRRNQQQSESENNEPVPLLSLGSAARREMLLERLPYMTQIVRGRKSTLHSLKLRDLEKVVSFQGIGAQQSADEVLDEEDAAEDEMGPMAGQTWATDRPLDESLPRKKAAGILNRNDGAAHEIGLQSLVLSDDDIEDD